jgi:hypothetical protein
MKHEVTKKFLLWDEVYVQSDVNCAIVFSLSYFRWVFLAIFPFKRMLQQERQKKSS